MCKHSLTVITTYIDFCVDYVNKTTQDNDEIKHIPRISKVVLQNTRYYDKVYMHYVKESNNLVILILKIGDVNLIFS